MDPKVLLIRPPVVHSRGRVGSNTASPPLGIAYMASYLREKGIEVSVLDAFAEAPAKRTTIGGHHDILGLTNEEIVERIPDGTDVIGVSCIFSDEWFYIKRLLFGVKERFPGSVLAIGGDHATALAMYNMESCSALDFVVMGEGEVRFYNLIRCLFGGKGRLEDIEGLLYRKDDRIMQNTPWGTSEINSSRIKDVDGLPPPAWDIIPIESYFTQGLATIASKGKRMIPVLSSRGCPYSCKFCSNNIMWGTRYKMRDCKEVIGELKKYKTRYGIDGFEFHDLTTIMSKRWIMEFCRLLVVEGLDLEWNVPTTRAEAIDEEVVAALRRAGCTNICLTPDSGSKFQLRDMNKRLDLDKVTATSIKVLKGGLILKVNLVIGFPNERHRDILKSLLYGMKLSLLGANSLMFYRFVPYPGSQYFDHLQKSGRIAEFGPEFDEFLSINTYNELSRVYSFSNHVSDLALKGYLFGGYISTQMIYLLSHPLQIPKMIGRVVRGRAETQIDVLLINLLRHLKRLFV